MQMTLTFETGAGLTEIARDLAARFVEASGGRPGAGARMGAAVVTLIAGAAAEHPGGLCTTTVVLSATAETIEVVVSHPPGTCGPASALAGLAAGRVPESVRAAAETVDCGFDGRGRYCRLIQHPTARSR